MHRGRKIIIEILQYYYPNHEFSKTVIIVYIVHDTGPARKYRGNITVGNVYIQNVSPVSLPCLILPISARLEVYRGVLKACKKQMLT
jgi:hypothetical protein